MLNWPWVFNKSDTFYNPQWSHLRNLQSNRLYNPSNATHTTPSALTDDDEGVVDVNAAKAVGGFADVGPRVIRLHLLDLQGHGEHTETDPAAVDVAPVFGPHYEGRRVSFHWTRQLSGAPEPGRLSVSNLLRHPGRSWGHTNTITVNSGKLIFENLNKVSQKENKLCACICSPLKMSFWFQKHQKFTVIPHNI